MVLLIIFSCQDYLVNAYDAGTFDGYQFLSIIIYIFEQ